MKTQPFFFLPALVAGLCLALAGGCSSEDSTSDGGNAGGAGGQAGGGGAGQGGKAGSGGSAGNAGKGGSSGAGASGKGGASGAGTSGQGGSAAGGQGGEAGEGQGGDAGSGGEAPVCDAGKADCDGDAENGCEANTQADPAHCGACDGACPVPAAENNQVAICTEGKCGVECLLNHADCDGDPKNGCEVDTQTDPAHCGACDAAPCPSGPGAQASCQAGKCRLDCTEASKLDCDGDPKNGCEVDSLKDPKHCGDCSTTCGAASCVNGACACAGVTQSAELLPLDLFVMMDKSGSMTEIASGTTTKWDAVKAAVASFVDAPASAGIGIGVGFFPFENTTVPDRCNANSECGAYGPCSPLQGCSTPVNNTLLVCTSNDQCKTSNGGPGGTCIDLGYCSKNPQSVCLTPGKNVGGQCGNCQPFNVCEGATCQVSDYAKPTVPIAPLNGAAASIKNAMNAQTPEGTTPTTPALKGALSYASTWAKAHPTHVVAVLLATDGFPSPECSPNDISSVAAAAQAGVAGSPSIRTYAIGVFTPQEQSAAQQNLNTIAAAGKGKAFVVTTGQNVTQQFLAALNEIRTSVVSCEYKLPTPQEGSLDLDKVNVKLTKAGTASTLVNAASAAACPASGGWYYDAPPPASTKIVLCPSTCASIKGDSTAKVEIVLGCATQKP